MPVGIFDSGLGGLTVFDAARTRLPEQSFLYLGDNLNTPYGTKDPETIYTLTCEGTQALFDRGCDVVILACNTASAVACKRIQETWLAPDKRVLSVFVPLIEAVCERAWGDNSAPREVNVKQLALFATPATVASRAFQRELAFRAIGVDVESQPCAGIVDALEDNDPELAEVMTRGHVAALLRRMPKPQAAILGCTHYPILEAVFRDALGPEVSVFSQAQLVADSLADYLLRHPDKKGADTPTECLTTGDPAHVSLAARRFLKRKIDFKAL